MPNLADDMFELSLSGYGTKQLAKLANIPIGDAILLQSESAKVSQKSIINMKKTVNELQNEIKKKDQTQ